MKWYESELRLLDFILVCWMSGQTAKDMILEKRLQRKVRKALYG